MHAKQEHNTHSDLCFLTATEAIEAFRSRSLSPVELTKALTARSEHVQQKINALTYMFPE